MEQTSNPKILNIIHFNDVYEVRENPSKKVCGGAARFVSLINSLKKKDGEDLNPLILFSGDLWNPSKLSAIFKGEHLLEIINSIGIHASALGNHDLVNIKRIILVN